MSEQLEQGKALLRRFLIMRNPVLYQTNEPYRSRVAEWLSEELEDTDNESLAVFYCSRNKQNAIAIIRSLIAQLGYSGHKTVVAQGLKDTYDNSHSKHVPKTPTNTEWLDLLIQLAKIRTRCTVVIDAIDECNEHQQLLAHMKKVSDETPTFKLFASCRLDVLISPSFSSFGDLEISKYTQSDLRKYIEKSVETEIEIFADGKYSVTRKELAAELESKAQGM